MKDNGKISSIKDLLKEPLRIPEYQRPYKWTRKNVADLLDDINTAIADSRRPDYDGFKYRIGTVILHKDDKGIYNIVDGQQRLITLSLIMHALDGKFVNSLLEHKFSDSISIERIFDNNQFIREWMISSKDSLDSYREAFETILEAVVLKVEEISEAFQLFDSQNARGKELDPHDLLKAYHLREMQEYPFEKLNLIKRWEDIRPRDINELFSLYLYPILNWSHKEKSKTFTAQDIDVYKGVDSKCSYTYAQRVRKSMPCFQINEPFCAGSEFFKMVEHYVNLLKDLKFEINNDNNNRFAYVKKILGKNVKQKDDKTEQYNSTGFRYAVNLFYCVLLFYYDRFHSLDEMAVKKLFAWAMMIRVDMDNLGFDTINNYAIGNVDNNSYTNHIPMFFKIAIARNSSEITSLRIQVVRNPDEPKSKKWENLYQSIKELMGAK